jgi:hypothetical protein
MALYQRQPAFLEAVQFIYETEALIELQNFCPDISRISKVKHPNAKATAILTTHRGELVINEGDFISKTSYGDFLSCAPEFFLSNYELVKE